MGARVSGKHSRARAGRAPDERTCPVLIMHESHPYCTHLEDLADPEEGAHDGAASGGRAAGGSQDMGDGRRLPEMWGDIVRGSGRGSLGSVVM